ncbi:MAG: hypothetical protein COV48_09000 [Elusimicrobia bacterium CG11_big_fil_rev_8_21_14_0_20_64_6]|nr:MAG: hypothetical protein COV48_09000 [Elusimicrobia bacterium CG11_big_fil_rev_8_21_14_0_20_64_6]
MRFIRDAIRRLGVVNGLFAFLWKKRLWWMIPILLAVICVAILVALASQPAAAPFIYTLF